MLPFLPLFVQTPPAEFEPIPATHGLVRYAQARSLDLFAAVPSDQKASTLPDNPAGLALSPTGDFRWRVGQKEYVQCSALSLFPRDTQSLESRQTDVLRNVRRLLLETAQSADATHYSVYDRLSNADRTTRNQLVSMVYTGYEKVPDGTANMALAMTIAPGYVFTPTSGDPSKSYALDRIQWSAKPLNGTPVVPPDLSLESARNRELSEVLQVVGGNTVSVPAGLYSVAEIFRLGTRGTTANLILDARFASQRMLVVPSGALTQSDLVAGLCRTWDLYPRRMEKGWMLAISPQNPAAMLAQKRQVVHRNLVGDILTRLYALGKIPAFIPYGAFLTPDSNLAGEARTSLLTALQGGLSTAFTADQAFRKQLGTGESFRISCYLSLCVGLSSETQTINGCTTYP